MFTWYLHELGHHVTSEFELRGALEVYGDESGRTDATWIRPIEPSTKSNKSWRRYAPLESNPALFRTFVDVDQSQETILGFADRFGLLTDPEKGEPLATWRAAITDMRRAVECWETVQKAGGPPFSLVAANALYSSGSFGAATLVNPAADVDRVWLSYCTLT